MPRLRSLFRPKNEAPTPASRDKKERRHSIAAPILSQPISSSLSREERDHPPGKHLKDVKTNLPITSVVPKQDSDPSPNANPPEMLKRRVVAPFNVDPSTGKHLNDVKTKLHITSVIPKQDSDEPPHAKPPEMLKRRVVVPFNADPSNPYVSSTEFVVDARYENLHLVGTGRFGVVMSALDTKTQERVAIKKVFDPFVSVHSTRHVLREMRLLRHLRHPHIVPLLDVDIPRNYDAWDAVYLATPLLRTDLRSALLRGSVRSRRTQKRILAQVLTALHHMHRAHTMHRDLKSLNVLLDKRQNAQICDLGEARFYSKATGPLVADGDAPGGDKELTVGPRTPLHSAPELFLNEQYNDSVDMWGVGCIAAEMLHPKHKYLFDDGTRKSPMHMVVQVIGYPTEEQMGHLKKRSSRWYMTLGLKKNQEGSLRNILTGKDGSVDEEGLDFVEKCLKFSPKERMTAQEALEHPFLAEVAEEVISSLDANRGRDENGFNFRLTEPDENCQKKQLKDLVWQEVLAMHPEAEHMGIR